MDFVVPDGLSEPAKRDLLALAGTLLEQVGDEGPAIRVKFAGGAADVSARMAEPLSGVRRAVPPPDEAANRVAC
jgi:hypothetical protein